MEPTLYNLVEQDALKWIFVGGKGGVGKTTTSCCLGVQLAAVRKSVLIVSTDPAHNLSDAFGQKFTRKPTLVAGFDNLYCMEIDPSSEIEDAQEVMEGAAGADDAAGGLFGGGGGMFKDIVSALPGIDEAMSFMELMKHMKSMEFDVTVFDTAPTGHTLRLLNMPSTLDAAMTKVMALRDKFGGIMGAATSMLGGGAAGGLDPEAVFSKLDEIKRQIDQVQARLRNPDETTFVCVCIPEFLSLYETERLVQELLKFDIDTHNIVVNQVLFVDDDSECRRCNARTRMQKKYLDNITDLYADDFHVVRTPLLDEEVRGVPKLQAFGRFLMEEYKLSTPLPPALASSHADHGAGDDASKGGAAATGGASTASKKA